MYVGTLEKVIRNECLNSPSNLAKVMRVDKDIREGWHKMTQMNPSTTLNKVVEEELARAAPLWPSLADALEAKNKIPTAEKSSAKKRPVGSQQNQPGSGKKKKSTICKWWAKDGTCKYGAQCHYSHQ